MLKLKLQYSGHLMGRVDSLKKTLMLGKTEGKRRRGQQRMRCLDSITDSMDVNVSKLQEIVKDRGAWHASVHEVRKSCKRPSGWRTTTNTTHRWLCRINDQNHVKPLTTSWACNVFSRPELVIIINMRHLFFLKTRRPGVLRFMALKRVGHDWATDLIWYLEWVIETQLSTRVKFLIVLILS